VHERPAQPRAQNGHRRLHPVQGGQAQTGLQAQGAGVIGADLELHTGFEEKQEKLELPPIRIPRHLQALLNGGEALGIAAVHEQTVREIDRRPQGAGSVSRLMAESLGKSEVLHRLSQSSFCQHCGSQPEVAGALAPLR